MNLFSTLYESDDEVCQPFVVKESRANISTFERLQKENQNDKEIMDKVADFTKQKMSEHGLVKWSVGFDRNEHDCASTRFHKRKIVFSRLYLRDHLDDWHHIEMTVLHEIAHALLPNQGHTKTWKDLCISIGGDGIVGYD